MDNAPSNKGLKRWLSDDFLGPATVLMGVSLIGMALNMVCRIVLGRLLTTTAYGEMEAILQLVMIVGVPLGAIQATVAQYTASHMAQGQADLAGAVFWRVGRRLGLYLLGVLIVLAVGLPSIQSYFYYESPLPILAGAAILVSTVLWSFASGGLQGSQRFLAFGATSVLGAAVRIGAAWILIGVGLGAAGALFGFATANIVMAGVGILFVKSMLHARFRGKIDTRPMYRYLWPTMFTMLVASLLAGLDMVAVKRLIPAEAGSYARATSIGRIVVFLAGPVLTVLFPMVAARKAEGKGTEGLLWKSVGLSALFGISAALFCTVWPSLPIVILHGQEHISLGPMVAAFAWAMVPNMFLGLLIQYLLARRDFRFLFFFVPLGLAYVAALWVFHSSVWTVITVVGIGNFVCAGGCAVAVFLGRRGGEGNVGES